MVANKLIIPKRDLLDKFLLIFYAQEGRLSAHWRIFSLMRSVIVAMIAFLITAVLSRGFEDYLVVYSILVGIFYFIIHFSNVRKYRRKILLDMQTAVPSISCTLHGYSSSLLSSEYTYIVPTMYGDLKFECDRFSAFGIEKTTGTYFDYYSYKDVEKINENELRLFIAN